jgi:hypothetical protein
MGRPRTFDYDEARRLRATGLTYEEIGQRLGVSDQAVGLACDPMRRARAIERQRAKQAGRCADCGEVCSFNTYQQDEPRCRACSAQKQAKVKNGKAYCPTCKKWKPLADFSPSNTRPARGVHNECRACQTVRRRDNRHQNAERERSYSRERRRRQKAAA